MSTVCTSTVTIANTETTSGAADLGEMAVVGIQTPASLTGTSFSFLASADNSTFVEVRKVDGTVYTLTVTSSKYYVVPPADLAGIRYLKIVSGSAETGAKVISILQRQV